MLLPIVARGHFGANALHSSRARSRGDLDDRQGVSSTRIFPRVPANVGLRRGFIRSFVLYVRRVARLREMWFGALVGRRCCVWRRGAPSLSIATHTSKQTKIDIKARSAATHKQGSINDKSSQCRLSCKARGAFARKGIHAVVRGRRRERSAYLAGLSPPGAQSRIACRDYSMQ